MMFPGRREKNSKRIVKFKNASVAAAAYGNSIKPTSKSKNARLLKKGNK